ncbi:Cytochrome bd-I ubiquinol oxidase subunit X [Candidatus Arsenophonus lipoptenae]|uniref:Cytochrome bd-I ubiquinol oxidase subunit X n=1 Tax=Candidatus Arsenophonus lipoptenae TaxID=634113 RepID=A0A109QAY4_9GAMM|nr:cytochrome bd-I oxidase subunit CydX [Candidatus Arsenophonus lipoptenae]AMA64601.1 Cytochrome bd-I ubiquinol oxidase subunit X [Candidatus Arsenophonus lipoptenae]
MWYLAWILGTLFACSFSIITVLALDQIEVRKNNSDD